MEFDTQTTTKQQALSYYYFLMNVVKLCNVCQHYRTGILILINRETQTTHFAFLSQSLQHTSNFTL